MLNRLTRGFAAALLAAVPLAAQAPPAAPAPETLWTVSTDILAPESVYFDAGAKALFVSNINGEILAKDGNGYISRLTPDGTVVDAKWATGLNAPKGIRVHQGILWVTDIDELGGIEVASGRMASRVTVDGAALRNDLATGPDGTVYVPDSQLYRSYAVKDGRTSVFAEGSYVEI